KGTMLGHLEDRDLLDLPIEDVESDEAPDDLVIHQAIYRQTDAHAVIYARPPWTMGLALIEDRLAPASDDGAESLGTVSVLVSQRSINSPELAQIISRSLKDSRIVAVR